MRGFDAMRVFPSIILALAVVAAAGPSLFNVVIVLGVLDAPVFARLVRAEVLALRAGGFMESAIAAGNPLGRLLFVHLMPNTLQGTLAQAAVRAHARRVRGGPPHRCAGSSARGARRQRRALGT